MSVCVRALTRAPARLGSAGLLAWVSGRAQQPGARRAPAAGPAGLLLPPESLNDNKAR